MAEINLVPIEYRERKERWKRVFSKTTFIVFSLVVLSLLVYGGLLLYGKNLKTNLESINTGIAELANKRTPADENAVIAFENRLNILKEVFKNHTYWTNFFAKLEDLTISQAVFNNSKFTFAENQITVTLTAATQTYTTLAQQMLAFQNEPMVNSVAVSNIALREEGGIEFNLMLVFPAKILLNNISDTK